MGYFCGPEFGWHWFEVVLLILSVVEVGLAYLYPEGEEQPGGASLFRVFRLVRLAKLLRICKMPIVADLVLMLNGVVGGLRTLFWSIFLISLPLYVVALVLRETLGKEGETGHGAESFASLATAFFSVFRCVVAGDCTDETGRPIFVLVSMRYGWAYGVIYAVTVVLMTFGLFNVIVAIYVENTVAAAKHNAAKAKEKRLRDRVAFQQKSLELALLAYSLKTGYATDGRIDLEAIYGMQITQEEFAEICQHEDFSQLLSELDIAQSDQKDLFDTLDADRGGTLDVNELISGIEKLRGDAQKADVVAVLVGVRHVIELVTQNIQIVESHGRMLEKLYASHKRKHGGQHQKKTTEEDHHGGSQQFTENNEVEEGAPSKLITLI
jgi:hypothetical protein